MKEGVPEKFVQVPPELPRARLLVPEDEFPPVPVTVSSVPGWYVVAAKQVLLLLE